MFLESGHQVADVSAEEQQKQNEDFKAYEVGLIRLQPGEWFLLKHFPKYANRIYNFQVRSTDVIIMTFPKCGTTWTQEIVWTMRNNPDLNNPEANIPVNVRSPFMDFDFILDNPYTKKLGTFSMPQDLKNNSPAAPNPEDGIFIQMAESCPDPRTIKSHLPLSLMPKNMLDTCKVVYVIRNPKDVCVSYHHHSRLIKGHDYVGDMDQFVDHFVNDTLLYSPFWLHVKEAWDLKSHPNMYFTYFEDMKADPKSEIKRLDSFLETKLTEQQIDNIVEYTSFAAMKARNTSGDEERFFNTEVSKQDGGFYRKGEVGDWKVKLTKEQEEKIDQWSIENTRGTDLKLK